MTVEYDRFYKCPNCKEDEEWVIRPLFGSYIGYWRCPKCFHNTKGYQYMIMDNIRIDDVNKEKLKKKKKKTWLL